MAGWQFLDRSHGKTTHVQELDGLRGILASWVVVAHVLSWAGASELVWRVPQLGKPAWHAFIDAQIPVEVFIILSGFAISFLAERYRDSYPAFMANRFFRIYPVYLVCLALGVATQGMGAAVLEQVSWSGTSYFTALRSVLSSELEHPASHLLLHLTLLNGLVPREVLLNTTATFLPPAWSISLEWQFYLVAPFLLAAIRTLRGLALALSVAWCGALIAPMFTNLHLAFLPSQLPLFLIGMASYFAYRSPVIRPELPAFIAVGGVGVAGALQWHWVAVGVWSLVLASVLSVRLAEPPLAMRAVRWLLLLPVLQYLGRVSFPLYLVHWPLIVVQVFVFSRLRPDAGYLSALAWLLTGGLIVIVAAAHLLHRTVEKPGLNLGRRATSWLTLPSQVKSS